MMSQDEYIKKQDQLDKLLNGYMSTPATRKKSGGCKDSQFWINKIQETLTKDQFAKLTAFSLQARYRFINSYDQVTRNPGEFATDISNRYIESLGFPPPEFYEYMKDPQAHETEINEILSNIPNEIIIMFAPWYDDFLSNDNDVSLKHNGERNEVEFLDLKKKQFLALAAFGAITWGTNQFVDDPNEAQRVKQNIINFKNSHLESFKPIIDKLDEARALVIENKQIYSDISKFSETLNEIYNDQDNKDELLAIKAFNDPYEELLSVLKDRFYTFSKSNKYKLTPTERTKCAVTSSNLQKLYDKIVEARSTGRKLSDELVKSIEKDVKTNVIDSYVTAKLNDKAVNDAISKFKDQLINTHPFKIADLSKAIEQGDKQTAKNLIDNGIPLDTSKKSTGYKRSFLDKIKDVFKNKNLKAFFNPPERSLIDIAKIIGIDISSVKTVKPIDDFVSDSPLLGKLTDKLSEQNNNLELSEIQSQLFQPLFGTHKTKNDNDSQQSTLEHKQAYQQLINERLEEIESHPEFKGTERTISFDNLQFEHQALKAVKHALEQSPQALNTIISDVLETYSKMSNESMGAQDLSNSVTENLLRTIKDGAPPDVSSKKDKKVTR